jgi:hypothetical protein
MVPDHRFLKLLTYIMAGINADGSVPTADQADSVSIQSVEKKDQKPPRAIAQDAELVTARGNIVTKDGVVFSHNDSDSSLSGNIFSDPEVRDYYKQVYEDAKYECRHVFDADAEWTKEEEKRVIRRLDWHGQTLDYIFHCYHVGLHLTVCLWACVMFFSLQIDRGNLTQAVSGTLLKDLHLTTNGRLMKIVVLFIVDASRLQLGKHRFPDILPPG